MLRMMRKDEKGFTLVEVIVVAVIVAVLALVGIQLYQGYATEARRNTAENLAASAASFLQTIINYKDPAAADALGDLDGDEQNNTWQVDLGGGAPPVVFTCPANAKVTINTKDGTVSTSVGGVNSQGVYRYKYVPGDSAGDGT